MSIPGNDEKRGAPSARVIGQKSPLRFVEAFIREPLTVGSFWPSSTALSQAIVDSFDFEPLSTVVELCPGSGAFTELLL